MGVNRWVNVHRYTPAARNSSTLRSGSATERRTSKTVSGRRRRSPATTSLPMDILGASPPQGTHHKTLARRNILVRTLLHDIHTPSLSFLVQWTCRLMCGGVEPSPGTTPHLKPTTPTCYHNHRRLNPHSFPRLPPLATANGTKYVIDDAPHRPSITAK